MIVILDVVALWVLTCLTFGEQMKWRLGHIVWVGILVGFIWMSDRSHILNPDKAQKLRILPIDDLGTLIAFCLITLLASSYLFKRTHITILSMTFLSLIVWLIIRMQAVLVAEVFGLNELWNHVIGLGFSVLLLAMFTHYIGSLSFENLTILQQFVLYSVFCGSMVFYGFYIKRDFSTLTEQILIICSILLCVFFSLFIYTQRRQQAIVTRLQATEEYVPIIDELVMEVRSRQHEFSNKILAITSIVETADSLQEARQKIAEFTHNVRLQPEQEQLLTMEQKIVAGFLYAKLRRAEQMGILVELDFTVSSSKMPCEEADFIEILGILLDNAFEASESGDTVKVAYRLDNEHVRLEVSNVAPRMTNEQMMKMFELGYSTKGGKRGFGLHNFLQMVKQYNAKIILKNEVNWLTIGLQFTA